MLYFPLKLLLRIANLKEEYFWIASPDQYLFPIGNLYSFRLAIQKKSSSKNDIENATQV